MKTNNLISAVRAATAATLTLCIAIVSAQVNTHGVAAWGTMGIGQSASSQSPVVQIVTSGPTSAALRADGTVVVWGWDAGGECSVPAGLSGVIQIAIGGDHMIALESNGAVVCWGDNTYGESTVPTGLGGVVEVAAGQQHSVALKANGTIAEWGDNSFGQLTGAPTGDVEQIVAGSNYTLALMTSGKVYGWGYDWETGSTTIPGGLTNVIQISASYETSLALQADGTMVEWGNDNFPVYPTLTGIVQVSGDYALKSNGTVVNWSTSAEVPGLSGVIQIASSNTAQLGGSGVVGGPLIALKANGSIVCYGDDSYGFSTYGESQPPVALQGTTKVSIGYESMAFLRDGLVSFIGANKYGESTVPAGLTGVTDVQTNGGQYGTFGEVAHSVALKSTGTVVCWGDNVLGENDIPAGLENVVQISVGMGHTAARLSDGKLVCWGYNVQGQCIVPPSLPAIQDVAAGGFHTVALTTAGKVVCWGNNYYGQCTVPATLKNVVHVAAGIDNSAALEADGTVVCWGDNAYGECAVPTTLKGVLQVAAGDVEMLARTNDGSVVEWGGLTAGVPSYVTDASNISAGRGQVAALSGLDMYFATPTVEAGSSVDLDFFLPTAPGSAGAEITLTSSSSAVQVPASVHLGTGIQSASEVATTSEASAGGVFTITAHYLGGSFTATLRVLPKTAPASSMSFMLPSVEGGATSIGYVKLGVPAGSAGETFTIKSSSTLAASGLATIEVPAGAGSFQFPVVTQPVASVADVRIYAYQGATVVASAPLEIYAPATLTLAQSSLHGGQSTTVTVHFAFPLEIPTGVDVDLLSSSPLVSVPATTIVYVTQTMTAPVTTKGVNATTNVFISMVTPSGKNPGVTLTLTPPVISSVSVSPTLANGNSLPKITVNTLGLAGPAGAPVTITESSTLAGLPPTITIPAGKDTQTVSFVTGTFTATTSVTVHATTGTTTEETTFTIEPAPNKLTGISLDHSTAPTGFPVTLTATLSGPSGPSGLTVLLKALPAGVLDLPASMTAAAKATTVSTTFEANSAVSETVTITATEGANVHTTTCTVIAPQLSTLYFVTPAQFFATTYTVQGGVTVNGELVPTSEPPTNGISVNLTSGDPSLVTVPPVEKILASGPSLFAITTKAVTANTNVTITAKSGAVTVQATLTLTKEAINPATLEGLNVEQALNVGYDQYVELYPYGASPNGFVVTLKSSDPAVLPLPATITIGKTATESYLAIPVGNVTKPTNVTVTASAGSVTLTATFTVYPANEDPHQSG